MASTMSLGVPSVRASGVPSPSRSMEAEATVTGSIDPEGASLTAPTSTLAEAVLVSTPSASVAVTAKVRVPSVGSWLVFS